MKLMRDGLILGWLRIYLLKMGLILLKKLDFEKVTTISMHLEIIKIYCKNKELKTLRKNLLIKSK